MIFWGHTCCDSLNTMNPANADSLRVLLRRIAFTLAASSLAACSSVVTETSPDASTDAPADQMLVDVPAVDVPSMADVPVTHDVPVVTDTPLADAPADVDRCAPRLVSSASACIYEDFAFPCGLPAGVTTGDGGTFTMSTCEMLCPPWESLTAYSCTLQPISSEVTVRCNYPCGVGRRVDGFQWSDGPCEGLGDWFAHIAALEGAAVVAFERMAHELRAWGAPASLVEDALAARDEEVDHTALTAALAARFGASPVAFTVDAFEARSLEDAARENAVEGCVRETYGALVAWWQTEHARDVEIARALRVIADDETRHAALSWRVHAWMRTRLDGDAFARVERARHEAVSALREELRAPLPVSVVMRAGLPASDEAAALFEALAPSLA